MLFHIYLTFHHIQLHTFLVRQYIYIYISSTKKEERTLLPTLYWGFSLFFLFLFLFCFFLGGGAFFEVFIYSLAVRVSTCFEVCASKVNVGYLFEVDPHTNSNKYCLSKCK